jgi:hypothetical protein
MPEAVAKARVQARTVLKGAGGPEGGNLIVEVIEPPFLVVPAPPVAQPFALLSEEELAARAARRAAEPNEFRLFSPSVVTYDNGISLISWWTADRKTGYQEYSAFVNLDLSSIFACGDLTVGRRRYCMMAMGHKASDRFVAQVKPPAPITSLSGGNTYYFKAWAFSGAGASRTYSRGIEVQETITADTPIKVNEMCLYRWDSITATPVRVVADLSPYAVRPEGVNIITLNGDKRILFVEDRYKAKGYDTQNAVHWPVGVLNLQ